MTEIDKYFATKQPLLKLLQPLQPLQTPTAATAVAVGGPLSPAAEVAIEYPEILVRLLEHNRVHVLDVPNASTSLPTSTSGAQPQAE